MTNLIVAGILLVIIAAAVWYIIKSKKSGVKCIGCPLGESCSGNCVGEMNSISSCYKEEQE